MSNIPRLIQWSIATAIAACLAGPASALDITLEDFEGYSPGDTPTSSAGDVSVDDGTFGIAPYQGLRQAVVGTNAGLARTTVETTLGMAANTIENIFHHQVRGDGYSVSKKKDIDVGSAFQISFTAQPGDLLRFDWTMLTNEFTRGPPTALDTYTDYGWYSLAGGDAVDGVLANVNDGSFPPPSLGPTAYDRYTGQQTTELTLTTGGDYTITVGINDVADANNNFASALVFDYFRLFRMPEPGTFGTVASGLAALSWLSRRRRLT